MKRAIAVSLALVMWLLSSAAGAPPASTQPPSNTTAVYVSPSHACIPTDDILSLIVAIRYTEENWLYTIGGNTIGEHMWWYALVGLSETSEPPLSRLDLEETVRALRENGEVANEFETFLAYETVQNNSNARDFFRTLTFLCERDRLPQSEKSMEASLDRALWSLHDQLGGYIPPKSHIQPGNDRLLRHTSQKENGRVTFEFLGECTVLLVITQFDSHGTADIVRGKLNGVPESCTRPDLILDLRDNPGGLLREAIEVSDLFLSEGIIVYEIPKNPADTIQHRATDERLDVGKIAILVNNATASAAELVSAALADNDRAKLIGERTYGKGVGRTRFGLPNGGQGKITTFYVHTPTDASFHRTGLVPSVSVPSVRTQRVLGLLTDKDEELLERFSEDSSMRVALRSLNSPNQ